MLKITLFEFIVRGIPEEFLFVFAVYTFTRTAINLKKYLIASGVFWISEYLIRSLPIQYGINTVIGLIALIIIAIGICKIDTVKSIRAGIIAFLLCFICEGITILFINFVLRLDINAIMGDPILKTLYGLPALLIFGIVTGLYYYRLYRNDKLACIELSS